MSSDIELFRGELERLLASPEFSSSRQLQEFLRYTSERAFAGAEHLDQTEIADAVLRRGSGFNPVEDASVRKLASMVRQRLEQHYTRGDSGNPVIVTLPVRSYLPQFQKRTVVNDELPVRTPPPTRRRWWLAVGLLGAAAITGLAAWRLEPSRNRSYTDRPITIQTVHGDIAGPGADVDTSGVRVGLPVGPGEDVSALLEFSPDEEAEQAGVLIWQDQDNYIQLGRRFMGRNQVVFLMEEAGHSSGEPENLRYDSDGQNGQPLWLAIRRSGNTYLAFTSTDGENWRQEGRSLTPQTPFRQPRAAIYAFYGRREAKPEPAVFSHLSVGRTFFGWQNGSAEDELLQQGWSRRCSCGSGCGLQPEPLGLSLSLPGGPDACQVEWTRPLGQTDWTLTTRLDYFPMPGVSAGIGVRGPKGAVRLVRYFLNEPSISLIYDGKMLIGEPDRNGSPAVYLRLAAQGGVIRAAFSQDGQHYRRLPAEIPLAELGSGLNAGLRMNASGSSRESFPARFDFFRQSIDHLTLYR